MVMENTIKINDQKELGFIEAECRCCLQQSIFRQTQTFQDLKTSQVLTVSKVNLTGRVGAHPGCPSWNRRAEQGWAWKFQLRLGKMEKESASSLLAGAILIGHTLS